MIDQLAGVNQAPVTQKVNSGAVETKKVLKMVKNERMGGMVPKWVTVKVSEQENIQQNLSNVQGAQPGETFEEALAYQQTQIEPAAGHPQEEFGFGDLFDMVNPLQHIPVVGHVYREITGDEIKPIGRIVGGALYGGVLGAAGSLANVIVEEETGKDIAGNAFAVAFKGETPTYKNHPKTGTGTSQPEKTLSAAARKAHEDLPASLLAFTDNGNEGIRIERTSTAGGRTAGYTNRKTYPTISPEELLARDPITEVILRRMPDRY